MSRPRPLALMPTVTSEMPNDGIKASIGNWYASSCMSYALPRPLKFPSRANWPAEVVACKLPLYAPLPKSMPALTSMGGMRTPASGPITRRSHGSMSPSFPERSILPVIRSGVSTLCSRPPPSSLNAPGTCSDKCPISGLFILPVTSAAKATRVSLRKGCR